MSVSAAADSGDELKLLYALRTRLAEAIEDCPVRDLSSLTRRLQDVVKSIREMEEIQAKEGGGSGSGNGDAGGAGGWSPDDEL